MADLTNRERDRFMFFLGGTDLEMLSIRTLLEETVPGRFHDKHLPWGAKASAYGEEIRERLGAGSIPVLVELEDDLGPTPRPSSRRPPRRAGRFGQTYLASPNLRATRPPRRALDALVRARRGE